MNKKTKEKIASMNDEQRAEYLKKRKKKKIIVWSIVGVLLAVFVLNIIILPLTGKINRVDDVTSYNGANKYICFDDGLLLSAHRAGGDLEPEETMAAFKLCMSSAIDYKVDVLEFDLHLTKDNELVLLHDDTVNRTSNATEVFGSKKVKARDKTLAELKTLNFGYNFKDANGNYKYRNASDAELVDVRILTLDEVLTYLTTNYAGLHYIIEIKDGGDTGEQAMDKLYEKMVQYNIVDSTIVGTFQDNVTRYIDKQYPDLTRSASIVEVLDFYYAFLYGNKNKEFKFNVLQIPMGLDAIFNFYSKAFISFAHSKEIAVQYWTINDADDVKTLQENGADCIMTDNPAMAYKALHE